MKILVVTECFWPDIYSVNEIVEKLVQRSHQVTVLTGLPDYTTSRIPAEFKHGRMRHHEYKGADVYRVPTIARRHGPIWRSLSYLSFAFNGSLKARFHDFGDFDVIYVWEVSPVTMAVPAITLSKRYHKPLFLYCMDIWPECVKAMNIQEGTLAYRLIHAWTRRIYGRCDHIAVSSKPFYEYMERVNGISRERMSYLPQFGDKALLERDTGKSTAGAEMGAEAGGAASDRVDFLFVGNIGKAQNLDCLLRAMTVFKVQEGDGRDEAPHACISSATDVSGRDEASLGRIPAVHLHIVGGGSEYDAMVALAHELGIDGIVTFYGPVPFQESIEYYSLADACVLTLDGSNHIGDTLPGKLQTYMAAGKPILAAANGATAEIIAEAGCGACVPAGDHEAYGRILYDFATAQVTKSPNTSSQVDTLPTSITQASPDSSDYGANARRYFREHFMEEQHFTELERILTRMIKET
ncbi:MAG: glycosyltransferase family 4 protein [Lachnospiraceae bacterium]|nr:glycosyltransferase family 4 protein [Lachnospiraceae bacterium]